MPNDSAVIYITFGVIIAVPVLLQLRRMRRREAMARAAAERVGGHGEGPRAQHPRIDAGRCIGCGACVDACPEGDVLAVLRGHATIVHGSRCIGHGLCAEACPVGAIEIVLAPPSVGAEFPRLTPEYETSVPNLFIVGELGGLALIKNAINQGRDCVDVIAARLHARSNAAADAGVVDVAVVGAGPGGLSAALRALERGLSHLVFEQDEIGGAVAKYPRRKLVLTSPVEFPLRGRLRELEVSKEELLAFWTAAIRETGLRVRANERVEYVERLADGTFHLTTTKGTYHARTVILALGRRGTPRALGIPGEALPKVMYHLVDAGAYTGAKILVVGGGDSAVEAALGLARQAGNTVTLSYRGTEFTRLKDRNLRHLREAERARQLTVLRSSHLREVRERSVVLTDSEGTREVTNDFVWIFAGGTPPTAFLERAGVALGIADLAAGER